jgi:hypothetical protein
VDRTILASSAAPRSQNEKIQLVQSLCAADMTSTENKTAGSKKGAPVDDCIFCKARRRSALMPSEQMVGVEQIIAGKVPSYKVRVSQSVELACTAHIECFSHTTVRIDGIVSFVRLVHH